MCYKTKKKQNLILIKYFENYTNFKSNIELFIGNIMYGFTKSITEYEKFRLAAAYGSRISTVNGLPLISSISTRVKLLFR